MSGLDILDFLSFFKRNLIANNLSKVCCKTLHILKSLSVLTFKHRILIKFNFKNYKIIMSQNLFYCCLITVL